MTTFKISYVYTLFFYTTERIMNSNSISAVILTAVSYCLISNVSSTCQGDYQRCLEKLSNSQMDMTNPGTLTAEQLNKICSNKDSVEGCIRGLSSCSQADRDLLLRTWSGYANGFKYLCTNKEAALSYLQCWGSSPATKSVNACTTTYTQSVQTDSNNVCRYTNELLGCTKRGMTGACGKESATFLYTYLRETLKPAADYRNCKLGGTSLAQSASFILLLGAALFSWIIITR
jgi:hypothetical protein